MCFTEIKIKLHYQHGILCQGVDGGKGDQNYLLRVLRDASSNNDWGLKVWL